MTIADIPIGLNTKVLHRIWYPRLVEGHVGSPESPWPYVASIGLKRSCPGPRGLQFLRTEGKVPAHGGSGGRGFRRSWGPSRLRASKNWRTRPVYSFPEPERGSIHLLGDTHRLSVHSTCRVNGGLVAARLHIRTPDRISSV